MTVKNESAIDDYLRFGRISENLKHYELVMIGNHITKASLGYLESHLGRTQLDVLDLNLYSNDIEA